MFYKILLFLGVLCNIIAQLFLKKGMKQIGLIEINQSIFEKIKFMFLNLNYLCGIFFYGIGFLVYSIVLSKIELSKAYPVASVAAIILISIISIIFLKEEFTIYKISGTLFCIAGIFLILK